MRVVGRVRNGSRVRNQKKMGKSISKPLAKKVSQTDWEQAVGKRPKSVRKKKTEVELTTVPGAQLKKQTFQTPPKSVFQQAVPVKMKRYQFELKHYCGQTMLVLMDTDGKDDTNYRTWAFCPSCRQLGLIHEGRWCDQKILSDEELYNIPTSQIN